MGTLDLCLRGAAGIGFAVSVCAACHLAEEWGQHDRRQYYLELITVFALLAKIAHNVTNSEQVNRVVVTPFKKLIFGLLRFVHSRAPQASGTL